MAGVEWFRSEQQRIWIIDLAIVITADRTDRVRREVASAGATKMNKPVRPAKLRALMGFVLDNANVSS